MIGIGMFVNKEAEDVAKQREPILMYNLSKEEQPIICQET